MSVVLIFHIIETTNPGTPLSRGKCNCDSVLEKSHCAIAKLPRTIRKPEHEFFLTADIIPVRIFH